MNVLSPVLVSLTSNQFVDSRMEYDRPPVSIFMYCRYVSPASSVTSHSILCHLLICCHVLGPFTRFYLGLEPFSSFQFVAKSEIYSESFLVLKSVTDAVKETQHSLARTECSRDYRDKESQSGYL